MVICLFPLFLLHVSVGIFLKEFPCGSAGEESVGNAGDLGLVPGLGTSPGEGKGYPLQYSGLKNFLDCIVHGIAKNQTRLSNFHFQFFSRNKYPLTLFICIFICIKYGLMNTS